MRILSNIACDSRNNSASRSRPLAPVQTLVDVQPLPQRQTRPPAGVPVALGGTAPRPDGRVPNVLLHSMPSGFRISLPPISRFRVGFARVLARGLSTTQKADASAAEGRPASSRKRRRRPVSHRFGQKHTSSEPTLVCQGYPGFCSASRARSSSQATGFVLSRAPRLWNTCRGLESLTACGDPLSVSLRQNGTGSECLRTVALEFTDRHHWKGTTDWRWSTSKAASEELAPAPSAAAQVVLRTWSRQLPRAWVVSGRLRPVRHSKLASVGRYRLGSGPGDAARRRFGKARTTTLQDRSVRPIGREAMLMARGLAG
jgi:hypothetical protein